MRTFVYHLGCEAGFFSEYNNMILAMLYCAHNQIPFSIYSKNANFAYKNGWNDYFLPFCEERGNVLHQWFNRRPNPRFKNLFFQKADNVLQNIFIKFNPEIITTSELWNDFRSLNTTTEYDLHEYNIQGDLLFLCQRLIAKTWNYNDDTKEVVGQYRRSLCLQKKYVGFHIRGGDKFVETDILDCKKYIDKAEQITDIRSAFVLTDDYAVFERLVDNYPQWSFTTLCGKDERGYFHQTFTRESLMKKREQYIKLFASIDILADADIFVGTFSSNPGMYLGMRMPTSKTFSVDLPNWAIW